MRPDPVFLRIATRSVREEQPASLRRHVPEGVLDPGPRMRPTLHEILALLALAPLVIAPMTLLYGNPADASFFTLGGFCLLGLARRLPMDL